jgi:hypothetical protein
MLRLFCILLLVFFKFLEQNRCSVLRVDSCVLASSLLPVNHECKVSTVGVSGKKVTVLPWHGGLECKWNHVARRSNMNEIHGETF